MYRHNPRPIGVAAVVVQTLFLYNGATGAQQRSDRELFDEAGKTRRTRVDAKIWGARKELETKHLTDGCGETRYLAFMAVFFGHVNYICRPDNQLRGEGEGGGGGS